jgi:serine/threonine protein phosphatase 1
VGRTIAIGDIHGCSIALAALLKAIEPQRGDTIVTLGDYVDRGIDSKGVIDQLIELERRCHVIPLLGNHEEMMLDARKSRLGLEFWLACGGDSTLASYDYTERLKSVPNEHWLYLERCKLYHKQTTNFFVHANYDPDKLLTEQTRQQLLWHSLRDFVPTPHMSGRVAVVGHTPQPNGMILDLVHLKCIDTDCCHDGWLTALDIESGQTMQGNERGAVRGD